MSTTFVGEPLEDVKKKYENIFAHDTYEMLITALNALFRKQTAIVCQ